MSTSSYKDLLTGLGCLADTDMPPDIPALPLDRGERQVIHVARMKQADLVLLDDSRARSIAMSVGLTVKGTLGIIVEGYRGSVV